jgi:DNA polymerase-2
MRLESRLEIKLEKCYDRFFLPRIRSPQALSVAEDGEGPRGRAKGYAGRLAGSLKVEIKGMEAVRSDWTPLARRFQTELVSRIFADEGAESIRAYSDGVARALSRGELDGELVFSRILRRSPDQYLKVEPPIVRAARLLGWTKERGRIEYVMAKDGARPLKALDVPIDYDWYLGHQLLPILRSIADTTGLPLVPRDPGGSQGELDFED